MKSPRPGARRSFALAPLADPRHYQIGVLGSLLAFGLFHLGFDVPLVQIGATLSGALGAQALLSRAFGLGRMDVRSPLISALSLCLLLRTNDPVLALLAGVIAIASKFAIRVRGKHVFNPTNVAIVALLLATDRVWVSPGQWGSAAFLAFLTASAGGLVVYRAARSDVTYAFLAFFAAIVVGRSLWLGDPLSVPLHRLESGALLIFAFFMISDPKTTPDRRAGRIAFAFVNAVVASIGIYVLHEPNALLHALVLTAPLVPVADRLLPGRSYAWHRRRQGSRPERNDHEDRTETKADQEPERDRGQGSTGGVPVPGALGPLERITARS